MKHSECEDFILQKLEVEGKVQISDLAKIFGTTESTVRRHINALVDKGLAVRTYGGAIPIYPNNDESFESKLYRYRAEKQHIAEVAVKYVQSGSTIALGSGTTVFALAELLYSLSGCKIYTNSIKTADILAQNKKNEIVICGGGLRYETSSLVGYTACEFFRTLNVDCSFVGCDAIDSKGNIGSVNISVATVEKALLSSGKKKYIMADTSKLGKTCTYKIANISETSGLITGKNASTLIEGTFAFSQKILE